MKLIIAGGRDLSVSFNFIKGIFTHYKIPIEGITEIVHGDASGIDHCGKMFAGMLSIPCKAFPYKTELGKAGGPVRNAEMAEYAQMSVGGGGLLLIWNAHSKGSASMKFEARNRNLPVWEVILCNPPAQRLLVTKKEKANE